MLTRLKSFATGGGALMVSALVALVLANSLAADAYHAVLHLPMGLSTGALSYVLPLEAWVNDGLMAIFFLLVGLEIRREMMEGQLASLQRAAAPAIAAFGGMVVPAAVFFLFAWGDAGAMRGWAVPVATDIAFSLAVLRVLGSRVPVGLRVFLTALAILDDLAAIVIIAVFYTDNLDVAALAAGGLVIAGLAVLNRTGVRALWPYMAGFVVLWACFARSGIHPTLAGVAVAFVVPMQEQDGHSPAHELEHWLTDVVALYVLPLFGLANAGLHFGVMSWKVLIQDPVLPGIFFGLAVGKPLGVFGFTWLGVKAGLTRLPAQLNNRLLLGAAVLCGIGFTMSLFIGHLAFAGDPRSTELKLSVFAASLVSALLGLVILGARRSPAP